MPKKSKHPRRPQTPASKSSARGRPSSNGDLRRRPSGRSPARAQVPTRRNDRWWVVTVALVSAGAGAGLLLGFVLATGLRSISSGTSDAVLSIPLALGAIAGVWAGAWMAGRTTGGDRRRFAASGIGGVAGLVVALLVAVAIPVMNVPVLGVLLPLVVILCPGFGAAAGAGVATRGQPASGGQRPGPAKARPRKAPPR